MAKLQLPYSAFMVGHLGDAHCEWCAANLAAGSYDIYVPNKHNTEIMNIVTNLKILRNVEMLPVAKHILAESIAALLKLRNQRNNGVLCIQFKDAKTAVLFRLAFPDLVSPFV